jgi:hypothetical protein
VVGDHVVQVARDAHAFGHDRAVRVPFLGAAQLGRAVLQLGLAARGEPGEVAEEVRGQEVQQVEHDVVEHGGQHRVERAGRVLEGRRLDQVVHQSDTEPREHPDDHADPRPAGDRAVAFPRARRVHGEEQHDGRDERVAGLAPPDDEVQDADHDQDGQRVTPAHHERHRQGDIPGELLEQRGRRPEHERTHAVDEHRDDRGGRQHGEREQNVLALLGGSGWRSPPPVPATCVHGRSR